ncbi:MAG: PH domain-containing protein [Xanthomonadales bacterium]|nr:PH domain-containing protein [Xanthomonadales bacterium]
MTDSSERGLDVARMRRLHPWSWLFVLLAQLRQFAVPLIVLLFFGRGGDWQEVAAAVSAVGLSLVAVWRYFTYRYLIESNELVIRSGLLNREIRHLPFARIHNIALSRSPVHRLFRVAEVRIESATGDKRAEATMQVLALRDAEDLLRRVRANQRTDAGPAAPSPDATPHNVPPAVAATEPDTASSAVHRIPVGDLIWYGLMSNQGWVVVGIGFGLLFQLQPNGWWKAVPRLASWWFDEAMRWLPGLGWALAAVLGFVVLSLLVRVVGVLMVVVRHYGFTLSESGDRVTYEGGLLTRVQHHVRRDKVQRWIVRQPWLLARRGLGSLHVETAAAGAGEQGRSRDALLPVAHNTVIQRLRDRWIPQLDSAPSDWRGIHPKAWRRMLKWQLGLFAVGMLVVLGNVGTQALPLAGFGILLVWSVRRDAAFRAYHCDADGVRWRQGAWSRRWDMIPIHRVQAVRLKQSPFDHRAGMAHLEIDTAGIREGLEATTLSYLAVDEARRLAGEIARLAENAGLLAPEHRRQQHQQGEHLESAEHHTERAEPDCGRTDVGEVIGHRPEPRSEIGQRRRGGAEGAAEVEATGVQGEHQQHETGHPQGDEPADRKHHRLGDVASVELDDEGRLRVDQLADLAQPLAQHHEHAGNLEPAGGRAGAAADEGHQHQQQRRGTGPVGEGVGGEAGRGQIGDGLEGGATEGATEAVEVVGDPQDRRDHQTGADRDAQEGAKLGVAEVAAQRGLPPGDEVQGEVRAAEQHEQDRKRVE